MFQGPKQGRRAGRAPADHPLGSTDDTAAEEEVMPESQPAAQVTHPSSLPRYKPSRTQMESYLYYTC